MGSGSHQHALVGSGIYDELTGGLIDPGASYWPLYTRLNRRGNRGGVVSHRFSINQMGYIHGRINIIWRK
jgi:hypothetical protein